jgi:hypothetical protein
MSTELDLSHPELAPAPTTLPNVRCAGRPIPPVTVGSAEVGLPDAAYRPCGWQDERYGPWGTIDNVLPCPDCGGRVSLVARKVQP